jgi:hypothetical protein
VYLGIASAQVKGYFSPNFLTLRRLFTKKQTLWFSAGSSSGDL